MTPARLALIADSLTHADEPWQRELGAWFQGVAIAILAGRMSGGCSEACHAFRVAAAMGVAA